MDLDGLKSLANILNQYNKRGKDGDHLIKIPIVFFNKTFDAREVLLLLDLFYV